VFATMSAAQNRNLAPGNLFTGKMFLWT